MCLQSARFQTFHCDNQAPGNIINIKLASNAIA